jgi:LuxR family transcriptional regulator, maltose regulon positive regulatory protein
MQPRSHRFLIPKAHSAEMVRERLLQRLVTTSEVRLIAVVAPSGYGKTTLLAQHARGCNGHRIWLTLSEAEADPNMLAESIALAACAIEGFVPEYWRQASSRTATVQADALAEDFRRLSGPLGLYLDGAEVLSSSAGAWLERFFVALPDQQRILISSFIEPPIRLARAISRGTALQLGSEELSFNLQETRAWLETQNSTLDARALQRSLEGWAAGLALATKQGTSQLRPEHLILEALDHLEPQLVTQLAEVSVLDVWSTSSLNAIGLNLPEGWLEAVRQAGLPVTLLPDGSVRAHKVLVDALESKLRERPERHRQLHRIIGEQAEHANNPMVAMRHFQLANDLPRTLRLAETLTDQFEHRWEPMLVRNTLAPLEEHLTNPLRRALGHALLETGEAKRGEVILLELARNGFMGARMSFSLGVLALHQGKIETLLQHAEDGLLQPDAEQHLTVLLRLKAAALANLGRYQDGLEVAMIAAQEAESRNDLVELGNVLTMIEKIETFLGNTIRAESTIARALSIFEGLGTINQQLVLLEDLIWMYHRQGKLEQALLLANRAIHMAEHEFLYMKPTILLVRAEVLFLRNDLPAAEHDLLEALRLCPEFHLDVLKRSLWSLLAENRLLQGQQRAALEALEWARIAPEFAAVDTQHTYQMCQALFALDAGEFPEAHSNLQAVIDATLDPFQRIRAQAYLLEVHRQQGTLQRQQVESLHDTVTRAPINPLLPDQHRLQALHEECSKHGWTFPTTDPKPQPARERIVLKLQTLGALQVQINHKPIHLPLTRCGELLIYLAVQGLSSRDQIISALWDGSNEQRHIEYFKVALKQLRATLAGQGQLDFPPVPISDGLYQLAANFDLELDFKRLRQAVQTQDLNAIQNFLETSTGPFLPETDAEWVSLLRHEIAEDLLEATMLRAKALEPHDPQAALDALHKATELEPLADQAWLNIIRIRLALGQTEEAKQVLGRAQRLRQHFGIDQAAFHREGLALLTPSPILPLEE